MAVVSSSAIEALPAIIFQFSGTRLELLNREMPAGITAAKLSRIVKGEWQRLIPEEFHSVAQKLSATTQAQGHTTVEFPVYWMGNTIWLRVFAAAAPQPKGRSKIIGLAQDVTQERHASLDNDSTHDSHADEDSEEFKKL